MTAAGRPERSTTAQRLLPVLLVLGVLLVAILTITPWPVGAFEDDAIYTVLAKSLATGHGFRMLNLPGAPHATHYPPGYPLLLSLLWRLSPRFPDNIVVFKFANAVLLSLAALGTWVMARTRAGLGRVGATVTTLAGTLSVVVLLITGVILSEPMFMALLFPALLVAERAADDGEMSTAVMAGLLFAAVGLVRTIGVVAVPAASLVLLVRGHRKGAAALFLAGVLPLVPWQIWVSAYQHEVSPLLAGKYGAYGPWLLKGYLQGGVAFVADVVASNARRIALLVGYLVMPVTPAWARGVAFAATVVLCAGGLVELRRRAPVVVAFLVAYLTVVLLWPFEPDRFLLAVWPLLVLGIVFAVKRIALWTPRRWPLRVARLVPLAAAAMVSLGYATYNARGYRYHWWASVQRDAGREAKPIAEWVVHHAAMTDVLATEHDVMLYLYTGRPSIPVSSFLPEDRLREATPAENLQALRQLLATYHPRYYITAWAPALRSADALAAARPPLLRIVGSTSNARVYETLTR